MEGLKLRFTRAVIAVGAALSVVLGVGLAGAFSASADDVPFAAEVKANNSFVYSGDQLNYQVNVSCSAPDGCGDVSVHLTKPAGASGNAAIANSGNLPGMTWTANSDGSLDVTLPQGSYGVGRTETFNVYWPTINWATDPTVPATTTLTANWSGGAVAPNDATIAIKADLDLSLTKSTPTASPVVYGQRVYYALDLGFSGADSVTTSHGMLNSHNVVIKDPLPYGAEFVECSWDECTYDPVTREVTWGPMDVQWHNSRRFLVVVYPEAGNAAGQIAPLNTTITNTATMTATTDFTNKPLGNDSSSPVRITGNRPGPGLTLMKDAASGWAGETDFRWTITAQNVSPYDVDSVVVKDVIPAGFDVTHVELANAYNDWIADQYARWTFTDGSDSGWVRFGPSETRSHFLVVPTADIAAHGRVTTVEFMYANMPQGRVSEYNIYTDVSPTLTEDEWVQVRNCVDGTLTTAGQTPVMKQSCFTTTIADKPFPKPTIDKSLVETAPTEPGGAQTWKIGFTNTAHNGAVLTPDLYDIMPNNVTYVPGSLTFAPRGDSSGDAAACPMPSDFTETIDTWQSAEHPGVTYQRVSWNVKDTYAGLPYLTVSSGQACNYTYTTKVNAGVPAGTYSGWQGEEYLGNRVYLFERLTPEPKVSLWTKTDAEDVDTDGNTSETVFTAAAQYSVASSAIAGIHKHVAGNLDADGTWFDSAEVTGQSDQVGTSTPGGTVSYKVDLGNFGNKEINHLVAYDLLPDPNSPGVTSGRYSDEPASGYQWIPTMTGPIDTAGAPVTITYSTKTDPCRPEMDYSPGRTASFYCDGNQDSSWKTSAEVTDWSAIKSVRFDFGDLVFEPLDYYSFTWTMNAPTTRADGTDITGGERTWNKIAIQGHQYDNGNALLAAEAPWVVDEMFVPSFAIGDYVWIDANGNGIQDANESPLAGVTVKLTDKNGNAVKDIDGHAVADATTNAAGYYHFDKLPAGEYQVQFVLPNGYTFTSQFAGTDQAIDSNADVITGKSEVFTLGVGEGNTTASVPADGVTAPYIDRTIDAGVVVRNVNESPLFAVGDYVWYDVDGNGIQDAGEQPVPGVTVTLQNADGDDIMSTTTDANGYYHFDNLPAGEYRVVFSDLPEGYVFTTQEAGSDRTVDSNPNSDGITRVFTLAADTDQVTASVPTDGVEAPFINRTIDAGILGTPSIDVEKWSTVDGYPAGDFDVAPGKLLRPGADEAITFTVTNNGHEALTDVTVSDQTTDGQARLTGLTCDFSSAGGPTSGTTWAGPFTVGASFTCTGTLTGLAADATHGDLATVTATGFGSKTPVDDTDPWFGHTDPTNPAIDIVKWSTNDGIVDGDYNDSPGKQLAAGTEEPITFTVTNTGDEDLVDVVVTDKTTVGDVHIRDLACDFSAAGGPTSGTTWAGPFAPGASFTCTGVLPAVPVGTQHSNVATVQAVGRYSTTPVDASDPWNGWVPAETPSVVINKYSTDDGWPSGHYPTVEAAKGLTVGIDEDMSFTVTNNGTEALKDVTVTDHDLSGPALIHLSCDFSPLGGPSTGTMWAGPFNVGDSFVCTGLQPSLSAGQGASDAAKVTGTGINSGQPVDDHDYWYANAVAAPAPSAAPGGMARTGVAGLLALVTLGGAATIAGVALVVRRRRENA